jgi:hypothetical protein
MTRTRGIVLTPAEVANEGVEPVLDAVCEAGATAVAISPGVFVPTDPDDGVREPPLDIAGQARVLDRPLWGRTVQYLKGYAPYEPDPAIWADVPFPAPTPAPAEIRVDHAARTLHAARARGLRAYVISSPTVLPGLPGGQSFSSGRAGATHAGRVVRVDDSVARRQIAGQGCINDPRVRALARARVTETVHRYPDAVGLFVDWAEYTCYLPEDIFTCFCAHCADTATRSGLDWAAIRAGVQEIVTRLRGVTDQDLAKLVDAEPTSIVDGLIRLSGASDRARAAAAELMRFKARSVVDFSRALRGWVRAAGPGVELGVNGFAPPWNAVTGADFAALASVADTVRCKLFSFHWSMMVGWLGEYLRAGNPALSTELVLAAATAIYRMPVPPGATLADYGMPGPEQPHPIPVTALADRLTEARAGLPPGGRLDAYLHSYRPAAEFGELLVATADAADGTWIQRYGYLSDRKLGILRDAWRGRP